jgi:hypothetical protein
MTFKPGLKRLVEEFEQAVREHEIRGCRHPQDVPGIEREYERTKAALLDYGENRGR